MQRSLFGRGQIIYRDPSSHVLWGAATRAPTAAPCACLNLCSFIIYFDGFTVKINDKKMHHYDGFPYDCPPFI